MSTWASSVWDTQSRKAAGLSTREVELQLLRKNTDGRAAKVVTWSRIGFSNSSDSAPTAPTFEFTVADHESLALSLSSGCV